MPLRVLVVEDQDDVRKMLVMTLEIEGYAVDHAANATDGLKRLQEQRYKLVLSDYAMPGGTGTWMLHEATRLGLMEGTVALIVTAHPDARDLPPVGVISKPLDVDHFLEQVRKILGAPAPSVEPMNTTLSQTPSDGGPPVELVLYISSASPASLQARRNLDRVLERFDPSRVKLSICDLSREPFAGDADRVAFTPTLVKRSPLPRTYVLGSLRDPAVIEDLLQVCGLDMKP